MAILSGLFNLEEERIKSEIIKRKPSKVLVQLPEGLRSKALQVSSIVEGAGALAIISADPCYGACDLALNEARILSADLLIHFGHSEIDLFRQQDTIPVIYIEAKASIDVRGVIEESLSYLKSWEKIGLVSTVQHVDSLNEAREILERSGKSVYIGNEPGLKYPGQVLGCDYRNCKSISSIVDAFLFIGSGLFHAVGIFLATMKPTLIADPLSGKIERIDDKARLIINRRWMEICEASDAKRWGVIIGLKFGQRNFETAIKLKKEIEGCGKRAILLSMREITPETLRDFVDIEAYVNTACPRISLYETKIFPKPVLTPRETLVALGRMKWEEYLRAGLL
ncbi:MAG: diphthamide biosynthesis enzyme Dph2 [Candidatus Bathyarchaeia archaeon]|nr:diphthamide biosynthesis enzyme Dph2 [Candidatus Bathyarchaeota archaeon]